MRVVSVGECMIEMAPVGPPGQFAMGFAGDTLNTAWYLRKLRPDWTVDYLTSVGTDAMSDAMVGFLETAGIGTGLIQRRKDRTVGLYLISLVDGERSFSYWRGQSAARLLAEDAAHLDRSFAGADVIYLSGITLAVLEGSGRDVLFEALANARVAGSKVVFDPNLRPGLWATTQEMRAVSTMAGKYSDVVLPSYDDEAAVFGDGSPQATRDRWLQAGAGSVIVKNGGGVIHYHHDTVSGTVTPEPVSGVVDSTAAGDSFNAGLMSSEKSIKTAIGRGCAVAAQVIQGRGALVEINAKELP